jgi:hypothetical protein
VWSAGVVKRYPCAEMRWTDVAGATAAVSV